jgi:hypothetical protein
MQAQGDGDGIQGKEFILEAKLALVRTQAAVLAEVVHERPEQILKQGGGTMFVGIGQRGAFGAFFQAQVAQFTQAAGQAIANFAQTVSVIAGSQYPDHWPD